MGKSNTECRRIVKYLILTIAVQYSLARLSPRLTRAILFSGSPQTALWLTLLTYGYPLVITAVCTLVNRYFTFHTTKKWYIAVPLMMLAAFLWNLLGNITATGYLKDLLWLAVSYLLQRCVIYRRTLDTNNWYDHSHPAYEAPDEGVTPDEDQ